MPYYPSDKRGIGSLMFACPECSRELTANPYITPVSIQWCEEHKFVAVVEWMKPFADKLNEEYKERIQ